MARVLLVVLPALAASAAVALAASGDPKRAHTKADQHWAKTIVLRSRDLPTGARWTSYSTGGGSGGAGGGATPGCPGSSTDDSDLTETGLASSPLFVTRNRQFIIASAAWIYKTSGQAQTFLRRIERALTRCGTAALKAEVAATNAAQLVSNGVRPIVGTKGWWNYRIVIKVRANGQNIKSFVDLGFGQRGRATAWLILHGAYVPLPAATEAQLVRLVMTRMAKGPG
jgi:hypothetical protein